MEQGARNFQGARRKIKKEQGAVRDEKGAVEIGTKERAPKNGREQGDRVKCRREQGARTPRNRASIVGASFSLIKMKQLDVDVSLPANIMILR